MKKQGLAKKIAKEAGVSETEASTRLDELVEVAAPGFTYEHLAQMVIRSLAAGKPMEVRGLGVFHPDAVRGFRFEPRTPPQVFIAYVKEDECEAARLYADLEAVGFGPWMDVRRLLPGQNWPGAIERAIERSDFFVACFSAHSVKKKGGFQAEVRSALQSARQIPLDGIFILPVRLDACELPRKIQLEVQYTDLFPDWGRGVIRLVTMMRRELERRKH